MTNQLEEFLAERFQMSFPTIFSKFYELIEYPIALPKNLKPDAERIKKILTDVTKGEVTSVLLFSRRALEGKVPEWMSAQDWQSANWKLGISSFSLVSELTQVVSPDFEQFLYTTLEGNNLLTEETEFRGVLWEKLVEDLRRKLPHEIIQALFCYLLLVITQRPKKVTKSFEEMVLALPYIWPIGEKKGEPGVWLLRIA